MAIDVYDGTIHTIEDRNRPDGDPIKVPHVNGRTWEKRPPQDEYAHVLWNDDEMVFAVDADWLDDEHNVTTRRDALAWWITQCHGENDEYAKRVIDNGMVEAKKAFYRYDPLSGENEWRLEHYCGHGDCRSAEDCGHLAEDTRRKRLEDIANPGQYNTPIWTECYPDEDGARDFWVFSWT